MSPVCTATQKAPSCWRSKNTSLCGQPLQSCSPCCSCGLHHNCAFQIKLEAQYQLFGLRRLDEGLDLVKQLQSSHGHETSAMGLDTLTRALAGTSVDRALRMLSLLRTRGAQPSHATLHRLMRACAKDWRPLEARRLYW